MHNSLNRVFRLVWNATLNAWCVAPETARGKSKSSTARRLLALAILVGASSAWAELPQGGKVSVGDGSLNYQGNQLNVQQNSDRMAVEWQSFSIGKDNKVVFNQPGADSIALNRVLGSDVSRIQGAIKANGQVFLLNPNGVLFSPTAQVNTGGLVASTLELSNEDFMAGNFQFEGDSTAAVTHQGEINVAEGGTIALIAATIVNEGSLTATAGNVLMGAGRKVTLDMGGPVKLQVDEGALNTLIEQGGAIRADGGKVLLTARAAGKLATSVINHTGITQAQTLTTGEKGEIVLLGDMQQGQVQVAGTLDASAPAVDGKGDGGFIETSAAKVKIDKDVQVTTLAKGGDTGEWLIDPTDFTISAGSEAPSESGIGADTLSANLEENNVTLATVEDGTEAGDMYVNGAVSWDAGTTLSLRAHNDIHINEAITGTNGGLTLNAGGEISAGGAVNVDTFNLQSGDWTQLGATLADFSARDFRLNTANASFLRATGGDGTVDTPYELTDLFGLQGMDSTNLLNQHFALANDIDASATASWNAGLGFNSIGYGIISYFTGSFDGQGHVIRGLTINAPTYGYVGLFSMLSNAEIRNVGLVETDIHGRLAVGGLTGGGLTGGGDNNSQISNSYVQGNISASSGIAGGLAGFYKGDINNSYSVTTVNTASGTAGGLVGEINGQIRNSYATGEVTGSSSGALVGKRSSGSSITNSYWNTETSGQAGAVGDGSDDGTTGLTTAQMFDAANFTGFDFGNTWANADGQTTPYLLGLSGNRVFNKNDLPSGTINASNRPALYTVIQNVEQLQAMQNDVSANYLLGNDIDATNTGSWNNGEGFMPVGSDANRYSGTFDGLGQTIDGIVIQRPDSDYVGLFGVVDDGAIRNVTLHNISISGNKFTGGLAGVTFNSNISQSHTSGSVTGLSDYAGGLVGANGLSTINQSSSSATTQGEGLDVGGLVGINKEGTINQSYATGNVTASSSGIGGLVGRNENATITQSYATGRVEGGPYTVGGLVGHNVENSTIEHSYATGEVQGTENIGGLVGLNMSSSSVKNSYATGLVTGTNSIGGLVGYNEESDITQSYATGHAQARGYYVGGLVGSNENSSISYSYATGNAQSDHTYAGGLVGIQFTSSISHSYATGDVLGNLYSSAGGLIGRSDAGSTVSQSYATGSVPDIQFSGGLIGEHYDSFVTESYWNTETSGRIEPVGAQVNSDSDISGLTSEEMQQLASYTGWDIDAQGGTNSVWRIYEGHTAPLLRTFLTPLEVSGDNVTTIYNGQAQSGSWSTTAPSHDSSLIFGSLNGGGTNAGSYNIETEGLYSNQQGYDLITTNGTLTIERAPLDVQASDASKVYDGQAWAGGNGVSYDGFVGGEDASVLGGSLVWGGNAQGAVNAGDYTLSASGLTSDNYAINYLDGTLSISKALLDVIIGVQDAFKVYDGEAWSGGNGVSVEGLADGETLADLDGSLVWGGTAQGAVNAGEYSLTASGLSSPNYEIQFDNGTLTIGKANLDVQVSDASKVYDGQAWVGGNGVSYDGFVGGEDASVLGGSLQWGGDAQGAVNAGDYTLSASRLTSDNYAINYLDGTLSISKALLDVIINVQDAFKVYDGEAWSGGNGVSVEGLANGETLADLDGSLVWGGTAQGAVNAGEYSLTASGLSSPNYEIRFDNGTLTIGKANLQVNVVDATKVYDAQAWSGGNGVSYDGFVGTDNETVLGGELNWGGSAQGVVNAGDYTLSVSGLSADNYTLSYQDGALSINKADLTVNVQDAAKTYDGQAWSGGNGVTYDGFVGSESTDALSGELSWGGTAQNAVNAGDYTLSVSGLSADNYTIDYVDGILTIDKADLTVTANDALWVQDGSAWAGGNGMTFSGFVAGDDASQLDGTLEWGGTAQGARDPGEYTLAASGLSADNYRLNYVDGQLQIISPMEAAGLPYRRAIQQAQHRASHAEGNARPRYADAQLEVVGSGIRLPE